MEEPVSGGRVRAVRAGVAMAPEVELRPGGLDVELLVAGLPVTELPVGARLRVGQTVVLELAGRAPAAAGGIREDGGVEAVAARVLAGGRVRPGDAIALEAVTLPLEDVLDLHAFRPEETRDVVTAYLSEARAAGLREVRIVHGRGRGVQRALIQRLLASTAGVAAFRDAPPEQGGWGATLVRLRPEPSA